MQGVGRRVVRIYVREQMILIMGAGLARNIVVAVTKLFIKLVTTSRFNPNEILKPYTLHPRTLDPSPKVDSLNPRTIIPEAVFPQPNKPVICVYMCVSCT